MHILNLRVLILFLPVRVIYQPSNFLPTPPLPSLLHPFPLLSPSPQASDIASAIEDQGFDVQPLDPPVMAAQPYGDTVNASTTTASITATPGMATAAGCASQATAATDGAGNAVAGHVPGVGTGTGSSSSGPLAAAGTASCRLSVPALFNMPSPQPVTSLLQVTHQPVGRGQV